MSLFSNGIFSTFSGLCFIAASGPISSLTGLNLPAILIGIEISLLVFATGLTLNAMRPSVSQTEAWIAVLLDLAWVVVSALVIFAGVLTTTGNWAVAVVADVPRIRHTSIPGIAEDATDQD